MVPEKDGTYCEGLLGAQWAEISETESSSHLHTGAAAQTAVWGEACIDLPAGLHWVPATMSHHLSQPL